MFLDQKHLLFGHTKKIKKKLTLRRGRGGSVFLTTSKYFCVWLVCCLRPDSNIMPLPPPIHRRTHSSTVQIFFVNFVLSFNFFLQFYDFVYSFFHLQFIAEFLPQSSSYFVIFFKKISFLQFIDKLVQARFMFSCQKPTIPVL